MNLVDLFAQVKEFSETPPGKVLSGLATSLAGAVGMWFRSWRAQKKARAGAMLQEEEEERDWEARCHRRESDLERVDQNFVRLAAKVRNVSAHGNGLAEKIKVATPENLSLIREEGALLKYILTDLEVEITAFFEERKGYLKQLEGGGGGSAPAPSPPAPETP